MTSRQAPMAARLPRLSQAHVRARLVNHWRVAMLTGLLAGLMCAQAFAGAFSVQPVRVHLAAPRDRSVAITVVNEGDSELVLQAETYRWSQSALAEDRLEDTDDLVLSPPVIRLPPLGRQVVRLAALVPPASAEQSTYRLILREMPDLSRPIDNTVQLPFSLAVSIPVFITSAGAAKQVSCKVERSETADSVGWQCANAGTAYAQVRRLRLVRAEQPLAQFEGGAYLLPGAKRRISPNLPTSDVSAGPAVLIIDFDDGTQQSGDVVVP